MTRGGKMAGQARDLARRGQTFVVCGGPRAGKTPLADAMGHARRMTVLHTDDLIGRLDWSAASQEVADVWIGQEPAPWVIEGVATPRALRKWLAAHPRGKPCDVAVWIPAARVPLTPHQARMAKSVETVWREVVGELRERGTLIVVVA